MNIPFLRKTPTPGYNGSRVSVYFKILELGEEYNNLVADGKESRRSRALYREINQLRRLLIVE